MSGLWLQRWREPDPSLPVLVCVPQAGAGSGQFRSWQQALGDDAVVCGVQLPGREGRWLEPPPPDVAHVISRTAGEVLRLPASSRLVVFGDSFGGLLAYELTAALRRSGRAVEALVVAACRPPDVWAGPGVADDEASLSALLAERGLDEHMDDEVRELVLEVLRKDIALSKTYHGPPSPPLDVPIHAWSGTGDRVVPGAEMAGWPAYTTAGCSRGEFDGGHHFCFDRPEAVLPLLRQLLCRPGQPVGGTARA